MYYFHALMLFYSMITVLVLSIATLVSLDFTEQVVVITDNGRYVNYLPP